MMQNSQNNLPSTSFMNSLSVTFDDVMSEDMKETLKTAIAKKYKDVTDAEIMIFGMICGRYDLDPFLGEIWFSRDKDGAVVPITGRDSFLKIAQKNRDEWQGMESQAIYANDEFSFDAGENIIVHKITTIDAEKRGKPIGAWARVHRKGCVPFVAVVPFKDYFRDGYKSWRKHPDAMIKKVAETNALKRQFGITGLLGLEEMPAVMDGGMTVSLDSPDENKSMIDNEKTIKALDTPKVEDANYSVKKSSYAQKVDELKNKTTENLDELENADAQEGEAISDTKKKLEDIQNNETYNEVMEDVVKKEAENEVKAKELAEKEKQEEGENHRAERRIQEGKDTAHRESDTRFKTNMSKKSDAEKKAIAEERLKKIEAEKAKKAENKAKAKMTVAERLAQTQATTPELDEIAPDMTIDEEMPEELPIDEEEPDYTEPAKEAKELIDPEGVIYPEEDKAEEGGDYPIDVKGNKVLMEIMDKMRSEPDKAKLSKNLGQWKKAQKISVKEYMEAKAILNAL